jgi:hypothetical protein
MMYVQAVDQVDTEAAVSKVPSEVKEPEGFGPEVIGCKIVNPWIDKN